MDVPYVSDTAVESTVGFGGGFQPSDSSISAFSGWVSPLAEAAIDHRVSGPLWLGFALRYEYVIFGRAKAHMGQAFAYAGLRFGAGSPVQHGPRLGLGGYGATISSQPVGSNHKGYGGTLVDLAYTFYLYIGPHSGLAANLGVWLGAQSGLGFATNAAQVQFSLGPRFDL